MQMPMSRRALIFLIGVVILLCESRARAGLVWIEPQQGADLARIQAEVEAGGGSIVTLAPEGRLLVRYPGDEKKLTAVAGVNAAKRATQFVVTAQPAGRAVGVLAPTEQEIARIKQEKGAGSAITPNDLSLNRASLQGLASTPSSVDNSLSKYFPPIGSQGSQKSSVGWAMSYYNNTYMQAQDENLDASTGDPNVLCSPAFVYNLVNGGTDNGGSMLSAMDVISASGSCSWAMMPYNASDFLTWPAEAAWVDALKRRNAMEFFLSTDPMTDASLADTKQLLANGHLAIGLACVYDNMLNHYPADYAGINNNVLFGINGSLIGRQAVTIVGYDDNKSYFNGSTTRYGAFLVATSWGADFGVYNTGNTSKGFMWIAYDYFKTASTFDYTFYEADRIHYRSRLYASVGIDHATRNSLRLLCGVGPASAPRFTTDYTLYYNGGANPISSSNPVVVDLNDGIPFIPLPNCDLFAQIYQGSSTHATMSSLVFHHDFDANDVYETTASPQTPVDVPPQVNVNASAQFAWSNGSLDHFQISAIDSPRSAFMPTGVSIRAKDLLNTTVPGFTGPVNLSSCYDTTRTVDIYGSSYTANYPFTKYIHGRSQLIYLKSELGAAATWRGIQFNIYQPASYKLTDLTIRMKHTNLSVFPAGGPVWETGYTTVYRHTKAISNAGWVQFDFDTPFSYNGTDNLMIDISYSNERDGYSNASVFGSVGSYANRAMFYDSYYPYETGDPLTWTGTSPLAYVDTVVPDIKLIQTNPVTISPVSACNFAGGVWNGLVMYNAPAASIYLRADDGAGHIGRSNYFNVASGTPAAALTAYITPPEAISAGAQWRRTGYAWAPSGAAEMLPSGTYSVEFAPIAGWITPPPQQAVVNIGEIASLYAQYVPTSLLWVDFAYLGTEVGTQGQPFCLLGHAVPYVSSGGIIRIMPGTSNEHLRITNPMRIESAGGTVSIGN